MRILFCNIAWMKYYQGITDEDKPVGGGSWVDENGECAEQWNFFDSEGYCYGYVATKSRNDKSNQLHIEKIEGISNKADEATDVLVVWNAKEDRPDGKHYIVGWYKDATVFRNYAFDDAGWPINVFAKTDDCVLLPLNERKRLVPRKGKGGYKFGMGQANVWFAEDENAEQYVQNIVAYIQAYQGENLMHPSDV